MPGAHWGSQYQAGAAIFLSASKAREKTRSHREQGIPLHIPPGGSLIIIAIFCGVWWYWHRWRPLKNQDATELIPAL